MSDKCKTESCVACSVQNCVYHTDCNTCDAGKIQIGNTSARTTGETFCDTFQAK